MLFTLGMRFCLLCFVNGQLPRLEPCELRNSRAVLVVGVSKSWQIRAGFQALCVGFVDMLFWLLEGKRWETENFKL